MMTRRRTASGKRKIVVSSPPCVPIRYYALTALQPYKAAHSMKTYAESATKQGKDGTFMLGTELVLRNVAEVTVPEQRARWVEYLLLCSGYFRLLSKPIDPMNAVWAEGNGYQLPTPWNPQEQKMIAQSECAQRRLGKLHQNSEDKIKRRGKKNAPERMVNRLVRFVRG